jgi:NAD(P)-dependent dehydrogenase (short-subunit alcohol dehydrogenase family)
MPVTEPQTMEGRVAIVTGSGRGLGRSYALAMAARGAALVINDIGVDLRGENPSHEPAESVVAEIVDAGGRAVPSFDSVATREGATAIVQTAIESFGRIDAVVNNALGGGGGELGALDDEGVMKSLDTQVRGSLWVTSAAFPYMREQQFGRFVFITSSNAVFGAMSVMYGVSKMGLVGLMHATADAGAEHGILANALAPIGVTRLNMFEHVPIEELPERSRRMSAASRSLKARGPEFVAPLVAYLCSPECTVTQETFSAVGGRFARIFTGVTPGWWGPQERPATIEEIIEHLDEIEDQTGYAVPRSVTDELELVAGAMPGRD